MVVFSLVSKTKNRVYLFCCDSCVIF
ncbi:MAG: TRASH domain-containing protein [Bacteriovorax sp.]|nr:TRASH domain-containing protein [Bacteriovorax sp.]